MTVQKIQSGRIITQTADEFVGNFGTIFYNESLGDLRLGDGVTPGGIPLNLGGGGSDAFNSFVVSGQGTLVATTGTTTLQFVAGLGIKITTDASALPYKTMTFESDMFNATLDGGVPNSNYGGLSIVDGGGV